MTTPNGLPMPVEVPAPGFERYAYGLLSAASVVPLSDDRWEAHGIVYQTDACTGSAQIWNDPCLNPPDPPAAVTAFVVTLTKAAGTDTVVATLTSKHTGYGTTAVTVNVDGDVETLTTVGQTANFPVTASTTVDAFASNTANGVYPQCTSATVPVNVPATGDALTPVTLQCQVTPAAVDPTKDVMGGPVIVEGLPFLVFDGIRCPGMTAEEARTRAEQRLAHNEQALVETQFHNTVLRDDTQTLATGVALTRAIGLLEDYIAETFGGIGVIHVPREFGALVTSEDMVRRDGARLRSPMDNVFAFGAGYPNVSPAGVAAAVNTGWIYATGPVVARRSEVQVRDSFDQRFNTRFAIAERSYVITAECPRAAVQFTHSEA